MTAVKRQQGFTLPEVMIALTIFAIISGLAWQILDGAMKTSAASDARSAGLSQIQRAYNLLERDFFQLQARSPAGSKALFSATEDAVALTTLNGVSGQLQLEHVAWRLHDRRLWRDVWSDIDVPEGTPEEVPIVGQVKAIQWRFWCDGWQKKWDSKDLLPQGTELTLTMEDGKRWRWVFTSPAGRAMKTGEAQELQAGDNPALTAAAQAVK